jgi:hypothetical protein
MFGPGDHPAAYASLRIDLHADRRQRGSRKYRKYCVVAHKDDVETMLSHCATQIQLRGI